MNIVVYCSSREALGDDYEKMAQAVGCWIGSHRHTLVYGGVNAGLMHTFALPDGTRFEAAIANVKPTGTLCLLTDDERLLEFAFKEVAFVI